MTSSQWIENFFCLDARWVKKMRAILDSSVVYLLKSMCWRQKKNVLAWAASEGLCLFHSSDTCWLSIAITCAHLAVGSLIPLMRDVGYLCPFCFLFVHVLFSMESHSNHLRAATYHSIDIAACWCSSNRSTFHYFEFTLKPRYVFSCAHNGRDWVKEMQRLFPVMAEFCTTEWAGKMRLLLL